MAFVFVEVAIAIGAYTQKDQVGQRPLYDAMKTSNTDSVYFMICKCLFASMKTCPHVSNQCARCLC